MIIRIILGLLSLKVQKNHEKEKNNILDLQKKISFLEKSC